MANRERRRDDDWARQVPWERSDLPYRSYGWERGQSALPQFRDPEVHRMPEDEEELRDWERRNRWRFRGPFTGVGPRNYIRSDAHIAEDINDRLTFHGQVDARGVSVDVEDGQVILSGTVPDRWMKRQAEVIAYSVAGVKDVQNRIRLESRTEQEYEQAAERPRGRGRPRKTESQASGRPGGGKGRREVVKGSGVYPASGPLPEGDAEAQGMASWGQGERGAQGYYDHGESELPMPGEGDETGRS